MNNVIDPTQMTLDQQLDYLFEGTCFADETSNPEDKIFESLVGSLASLHNKVQFGSATEDEVARYKEIGLQIQERREKMAVGQESIQLGESRSNKSIRKQMRLELKKKLEKSAGSGVPLRVYIGVDPTRTSLHIGHMVPVVNLRRFQKLGHTVIFLIGDYTATIGDPSGQSSGRESLTHEKVLKLAKFYTGQAFRLLDENKTEVRFNGEWLAGLGFAQLAELAGQFSLSQVVARQDFRDRIAHGHEVRLHESLYALMQGYDAYALNCDVQVGGYDQHMNLLAGRTLQKYFAKKLKGSDHPMFADHPATGKAIRGPHVMLTYPLLMGTDGRKMSKSWDNTIDVLDDHEQMFIKLMRISDEMIPNYIDVAIEAIPSEKDVWKAKAIGDPMSVKMWVAFEITKLYHGLDGANKGKAYFSERIQSGNDEIDMPDWNPDIDIIEN